MLSNQFWQGFQIGVEIAASVGVIVWSVQRMLAQQKGVARQTAKAQAPQPGKRR